MTITAATTSMTPSPASRRSWKWLRHPIDWALGPVFAKELRVASRRRRHYVLRVAYLMALLLFMVIIWLAADIEYATNATQAIPTAIQTVSGNQVIETHPDPTAYSAAQMAIAGQKITGGIIWFQFIAMQFLALVLCSSGILNEARQRTLATLLSTPISPRQIVAGKLAAGVQQLLVLLAISLPLLAMVRVLGGVDWMFLVASLCVTVTGTFLMGALSLRFSVTSSDPLWSMLKALFWYAILFFAPVIYAMYQLYSRMREAGAWNATANASWIVHCVISLFVTWFLVRWSARLLKNVSLEGSGQTIKTSDAIAAVVLVAPPGAVPPLPSGMAVSAMFDTGILPVSPAVSSSEQKQQGNIEDRAETALEHMGETPMPRASAAIRGVPANEGFGDDGRPLRRVIGSPLVWKELRFFIYGSRKRTARIVALIVVFMLLIYVMLAAQGSFREFHHIYLLVYLVVGTGVMVALAPQCIATEKQSQAMLALLTTPVNDWQIILAKALGVFKRVLATWLLALGHSLVCLGLGFMTGSQTAGLMLVIGYLTVFLIGLGMYFSSKFHTPTWAMVTLMGTLAMLWIILPVLPIHAMLHQAGAGQVLAQAHEWILSANPALQVAGLIGFLEPASPDNAPLILPAVLRSAGVYSAAGLFFIWRAKARLRKDLF